jgi:hypothetical protein
MNFIITLLVNAGILLGMTYVLPSVRIKNYGTAILVAPGDWFVECNAGYVPQVPNECSHTRPDLLCGSFDRYCHHDQIGR